MNRALSVIIHACSWRLLKKVPAQAQACATLGHKPLTHRVGYALACLPRAPSKDFFSSLFWPAVRTGACIIGLTLIWVSAPRPAWGQWNGTDPVWTNSKVGIGTSTTPYKLEVKNTQQYNGIVVSNATNIVGWMGGNSANGEDGQINLLSGGALKAVIATVGFSFFLGGNVGIGTSQPQYTLAVNGTVGARDVIVTNTGWPDYVFRPGYRLRPLSEVHAYIQKHRHLPEIPTEAEVKEKGVSLGEMQAKLLAKIEELTLHLIQQEKQNKELRERLAQLENRVAAAGGAASGR